MYVDCQLSLVNSSQIQLISVYTFIDRDNVWSYKYTIFYEKLVSKGILLHKLHTFLFNDVGNGIFSNTDTQHKPNAEAQQREISVCF